MNIQEVCKIRKEELKLTYQEISDTSGVPLSTVQNFFSKFSKAPSIYTVAPICKALGISLDEVFGISEHLGMDRADRQIAAGVGGVPVKIWI